jgi:N-acetylmuramoyl-L-alanine amidase
MEKRRQSPNISKGIIIKPEGIVLHHTAGSYQGSVSWIMNPISKVSYHCVVDLNGNYTTLAHDNQRAWHAGISSFNGRKNCNDFMLGIAVSGDTNTRQLNDMEIETVAKWCIDKMKKFDFGIDMITTHRAISPVRKNDIDIRAERAILNKIREWI